MNEDTDVIMNEDNRKRIEALKLGRQECLDDWYPTMENIKKLDTDNAEDREFMYWIYTHADQLTENQNTIKKYIAQVLHLDAGGPVD